MADYDLINLSHMKTIHSCGKTLLLFLELLLLLNVPHLYEFDRINELIFGAVKH